MAFAHDLQLSYVDAPPFVAYLNLLQTKLGIYIPLINRFWVIILHLISTLILMLIVKHHYFGDNTKQPSQQKTLSDQLLVTFSLAYIIPIFGIYGFLILPDSSLILSLSIMLLASDSIYHEKRVSIKNTLFLAIGLGVGLLSKYHILPLGGGMILGLYLDLIFFTRKANWLNLAKLCTSITLGLIIATPVFIWNYANHYASFIFQLQHGFSSDRWQFSSLFGFILGSILYLSPWFTYMLSKYGLLKSKHYYLLIPVISLSLILMMSSLRKNILPHWIAPAFWLLIPYTVINVKNLKPLKSMCKYTSILWLILCFILLLPDGILNIKKISKLFNQDTTGLANLLLWQELPGLFADNPQIQNSLKTLNNPTHDCHSTYRLIGTTRWYWTAQLEYHKVFSPNYKILNLDLQSSNFYTWRDNLSTFANCPILVIADRNNLDDLAKLINIQKSYNLHGISDYGIDNYDINHLSNLLTIQKSYSLRNINNSKDSASSVTTPNNYTLHTVGDYKSLNLIVVEGVFKTTANIAPIRQNLLNHPHY